MSRILKTCFLTVGFLSTFNLRIFAQTPVEVRSAGGRSLGLSQGGVVGDWDLSNIDTNPSLLTKRSAYEFSGSYTTPESSRDFYDIGILDSHTSKLAIGLKGRQFIEEDEEQVSASLSPAERRISLGLAQQLTHLSIGVNMNYVKAKVREDGEFFNLELVTFGVGAFGQLGGNIEWGVSWSNLQNRGYNEISPYTFRGGIAYIPLELVKFMVDYVSVAGTSYYGGTNSEAAQTVIPAVEIRLGSALKIFAAKGMALSDNGESTISGGVRYSYENWALGYFAMKSEEKDDMTTAGTLSYVARLSEP